MNSPLSSTPSIASRMRGSSGPYWAFTSTSGTGGTVSKSRGLAPPDQEIRHEREHGRHRRIVGEAEVVMNGRVASPRGPADTREREAPDGGADQGQQRVAPERNAEDPGRNGDEGAHHGRHPADEHSQVVPAIEPALGTLQLVAAE